MIQTVTGAMGKEELGATLSHEHIAWDTTDSYKLYFDRIYNDEKIDKVFNLLLPVFNGLHSIGCRAIAEASPPYGGQNIKLMEKLSSASGVKIIANTGMILPAYAHQIHREGYAMALAQRWIEDYKNGLDTINNVTIRPGYIKLLLGDADNGNVPEVEKQILRAAIIASKETGLPIHCHLLEAKAAEVAMEILDKENFNYSKFLWAHADHEGNLDVIDKAHSKGIWIGIDCIRLGKHEASLSLIQEMIKRGYSDKILLSQDYDFYKEVMKSNNNHPCYSFFTDFIPLCHEKGIDRKTMEEIITRNPSNFYDI